jgi:hypothetical protein
MGRNEQHGRIFVKAILSAVAVMYVPIDDEDSLCAVLLLEIRRADRDGIEQAKTHCATKRRMVAGGRTNAKPLELSFAAMLSSSLRKPPAARTVTAKESREVIVSPSRA